MIRIAIDGPTASGKSTIAKMVSERLGIKYLDTGASYRALTFLSIELGLSRKELLEYAKKMSLVWKNGRLFLSVGNINEMDITDAIRTSIIDKNVSKISSIGELREVLVSQQRDAIEGSIIMDGRDIGTVVIPDAELKIFLNASPEVRAKRRLEDYCARGRDVDYNTILEDLKRRDFLDSTREFSPLKKAHDAVEIITDNLSLNEVVQKICELVNNLRVEENE